MAGKAVKQDFFMSSCDNMPMCLSISFEPTDTSTKLIRIIKIYDLTVYLYYTIS